MNDKGRATICNYSNIIIIITFARLTLTKHQVAIASSNFESFSFRLLSAIIIMLSKIESKTQDNKRVLNLEFKHFSFSSDSDSNSIINFFVRDNRKRFKRINIFLNQSTFKSKSFISLTTFISSLFILSNQSIFKLRFFMSFILINITRK